MKQFYIFILLSLAVGAQTPAPVPERTVRTFRYLSDMDASAPAREPFVYVQHYSSNVLWRAPKAFRYDPSSTNSVSEITRAVPSPNPGRRIHNWDGDPCAFGMRFEGSTTNDANSNQIAFTNAIAWSRITGIPIKCPPGNTHVHGEFDVSGLNEISGSGHGGPAIQTAFVVCTKGATLFKNATTGMKFSRFWVRPLYWSWFRDDTTSVAIRTAPGESYDIVIEEVEAFAYRPLWIESFDSSIRDCQLWGQQGIYMPGSGTQSDITRVGIRGLIQACSTNSDTIVTFSSYVAGSTNLTVSDGSVLRAGDIIVIANGTTPGYSTSFIQQKNWGRRIMSVSGNDITISHPWPTSVSNGQIYYLLGQGLPAIYAITEQNFQTINVEWGSWSSIMQLNGPSTYNIDSLHVEGWCVYQPGANVAFFNADLANVTVGYLNAWNCSILDANVFGICDQRAGYNISSVFVRDIDLLLANKNLYVSHFRSGTRSNPVKVGHIINHGVPIAPPVAGNWEYQGTSNRGGEQGVWQERVGATNMHFYGFSATPTVGNFVSGDRIFLPTNTLTVFSSGSFGVPSGSNKIRINSRVLVTDLAAFANMSQRLPVSISDGVSTITRIVDRPNLGGPTTLTLASNANAGDRDVWVNITGSFTPLIGDWGLLTDTSNINREDIRLQRFTSSTTPDRAHLVLPLSTNYAAGSVIEFGAYLSSASTLDVTNMVAVAYPTPVFIQPIQPGTNGSFSVSGSATMGSSNVATVLDLIGGLSGQRHIKMTRPGVGTNSIGLSQGTVHFVEESVAGGKFFIFSAEATETTAAVYIGGTNQANRTNGIPSTVRASTANTGLTTPDLEGGDLILQSGFGTGAGVLSEIDFQVPANEVGGTTNQPYRNILKLKKPTVIDTNNANTGVIVPVWIATTSGIPSDLKLVATNIGGVYFFIGVP